MVGCVIVQDDQIIGEAWHKEFGGPHAEVNAVNSVSDKSNIYGSTVYVTLEPCSHHGKTPPCAALLADLNPAKVIIANIDSNPKVAGKGIELLKAAGIEVVTGVLEAEAKALNRRFFTVMDKNRPYVILKWAQTSDGFIAKENYDSKWISNPSSRKLVHKWRAEEDAILIGHNTAKHDNPSLTTRDWKGKHPTRIVIDQSSGLPCDLQLFNQDIAKTYRIVSGHSTDPHIISLPEITPSALLTELSEKSISSVIVEGGRHTLQQFIDMELWDEARVFVSETRFKSGIEAPNIDQLPHKMEDVFGDRLIYYYS